MRDPIIKLCDHCGLMQNRDHRYYHNSVGKQTHKELHLKKTYGLSFEEFQQIRKKQRNACAICAKELDGKKDTHVDHDHQTGAIRGLLCNKCNVGIAMFQDNPQLMRCAIRYLRDTEPIIVPQLP